MTEDEIKQLQAERDRYKELAAQALRDQALKRVFQAASVAAIEVMQALEPDEQEAFEKLFEGPIESAMKKGLALSLGDQALHVKLG